MIYYPSTYSVQYFKELMGIAQFSHTIPLGGGARYEPVVVHYVTLRLNMQKSISRRKYTSSFATPPNCRVLFTLSWFLNGRLSTTRQ